MENIERIDFELIKEDYPYEVLLLADETINAINKYLFESNVYAVKDGQEIIGVFCLFEIDKKTIELKNIAVIEAYQSIGIGSKIISFIKELIQPVYSEIIVGTPDCGTRQIRFYEKNGFQKFAMRRNFFIENYDKPIFENGIQLKDMVLLKYEL